MAEIEKASVNSPDEALVLEFLGSAYALMGKRAEAQKVLDKLDHLSKQKYVPPEARAPIYADLGEKDKAFEWLAKGFEDRSIIKINVDPIFDPIRSDPRFADLLRRMNLAQ
jgi:hypothetical protein